MQNILDQVKKSPNEMGIYFLINTSSYRNLEVLSDRQHQRFEELLELLESGELNLDNLSPEELKNFSAFIGNKENLNQIIREWQPWWENEDVNTLLFFSFNMS